MITLRNVTPPPRKDVVAPQSFTLNQATLIINVRDCYSDDEIMRAAIWLLLHGQEHARHEDLELAMQLLP